MPAIELHWSLLLDFRLLATLQLVPMLCATLVKGPAQGKHAAVVVVVGGLVQLALVLALGLNYRGEIVAWQFGEWFDLPGPLAYHVALDGPGLVVLSIGTVLHLLTQFSTLYLPLPERDNELARRYILLALYTSAVLSLNLVWLWGVLALLAMLTKGHARGPAHRRIAALLVGLLLLATALLLVARPPTGDPYWHFDLLDLLQRTSAPGMASVAGLISAIGLALWLGYQLPVRRQTRTTMPATISLFGSAVLLSGLLGWRLFQVIGFTPA